MAYFETMRNDLENMWLDMNNLFDTVDNDIIKTLNHYETSLMSLQLNENIIQTITENKDVEYEEEKRDEIEIVISSDIFLVENEENSSFKCLLDTISMQRIIYILCEYNKWLNLNAGYDGMYDFINRYLGNGTYSISKLLNDFYFILYNDKFNVDDEFEDIYTFLCHFIAKENSENSYNCIMNEYYFEQDKYEKCQTDRQRENFYGKYWNQSEEIVTLQILNKIYFYFFHSFDIGYKLTANERILIQQQIETQEMDFKMVEVIKILKQKQKQKQIANYNYTKYAMNGLIDYAYVYWFEYTNNEWFIYAKYSSIKEELLSNNVYHITPNQWNDIMQEAKHYHQSIFCKKMGSYNSHIHIQHIVALLLYTNFNILRNHFLETFYRKNEEKEGNESTLSLKSRHSNFAIFGRLLLESVQWFGHKMNEQNTFYHIINTENILFDAVKIKINIPFSATTNYNVILNKNIEINDENGMILKFTTCNNMRYFNASFLSKFVNEQESFLFGGEENSLLLFDDIIDYKVGYKHNIFLKALNIIHTMINGDWYKSHNDINDTLKVLVKHLILFQLKQTKNINTKIPKYIAKILLFFCLNVSQITIDWTSLNHAKHKKYNNWNGFAFLQNIFCYPQRQESNQYLWIKLEILYYLFPHMTLIKIITSRHSNLYLSQFMFKQILSFISRHSRCQLNEISIKKPMESAMSIRDAIDEYYPQFKEMNWNIKQTLDKKNDKYLVIHKK